METATVAQQPNPSQLFGKGGVPEGDANAAHAVDVEGVASQLQAVTIDGSTGGKDNVKGGGVGSSSGGPAAATAAEGGPAASPASTNNTTTALGSAAAAAGTTAAGTSAATGGGGGGAAAATGLGLGGKAAPLFSSAAGGAAAGGAAAGGTAAGGTAAGGTSAGAAITEMRGANNTKLGGLVGAGGGGRGAGTAAGAAGKGAAAGAGAGAAGEEDEEEEDENEILSLLTQEQRAAVDKLSKLQKQHDRLEHQYENELIALKMKYEALYKPLYAQRTSCLLQKDAANPAADEKGTPAVPRFWLECLKRNSTIADLIEEHDEPILEYLQNISCEYFTVEEQRAMEKELEQQQQQSSTNSAEGAKKPTTSETEYPESFRLIFDFAPNPYFTPTRLVKAYHLTTVGASGSSSSNAGADGSNSSSGGGGAGAEGEEEADDAAGAGAELTSTRSTEIHWEAGKDVTKKVVSRKQRNKKTRQTRVVQEVVDNESFFNFFTDHDIPTDEKLEAMSDKQVGELQMVVEADYDIGVIIRDRIIPHAVTWFLGEADDDDQMEDDMDEDEDADSDDLSDSEEEDERPPARGRGRGGWGGRGKGSQEW